MKLPLLPQHKSKSEPTAGPLQTIQRKLAQNALTEFKIGFDIDEFRSKRDVQSLINTIQDQYLHKLALDKISCLESIRIGWKLPCFALGPVLQQIVPMLLQQPAQVQHLQLMINSWVPLPTIQRLVSWHTLETLDLQSLKIRTRCVSDPRPVADRGRSPRRRNWAFVPAISSPSYISSTTKSDAASDDGFITAAAAVDDNVLAALPHISPSIKTLKLVNCALQVQDMPELIRCLRKKRHVQCLSLRHNRRLYMNGWEKDLLHSLPFLKALDLSICDLDPVDGMRLAAALSKNSNSDIQSLSVAGNYRIHESIPQLVKACSLKGVIEMDCSFCDVQNKCQQEVFDFLATAQPCSLRSLKMQAVRMKNADSLVHCIEHNTSLERLILDHPREPYELSSQCMGQIVDAVRDNYYLKVFRVDPPLDVDSKVLEEMEHWMTLNRCGRSILVNDSSKYWPLVLANTSRLNDIDTFYWMLRNGAEQF
jgi:hypothetical protein